MQFWGMTKFCGQWVPNDAEMTSLLQKLIYNKSVAAQDILAWTPEAKKQFTVFKQHCASSAALGLPHSRRMRNQEAKRTEN